jgi:hypothetical protein
MKVISMRSPTDASIAASTASGLGKPMLSLGIKPRPRNDAILPTMVSSGERAGPGVGESKNKTRGFGLLGKSITRVSYAPSSSGKVNQKVDPSPGELSTPTWPLCARMMARQR